MPPWKPDGDSPTFVDERRLTDAQIVLIDRWMRAGAPEGADDDLPRPPVAVGGWLWGRPDIVIALPTYTLRADGPDVFRNFVVAVPGRDMKFVKALQFRPRSQGVHHANIRVDLTGKDKTVTMFQSLVSAMLNVMIGNDGSCINVAIADGNKWLVTYPLGSNVSGGSAAWVTGDPIHNTLDAYDNGLFCAPHRQ
jgi:hypothetical protein